MRLTNFCKIQNSTLEFPVPDNSQAYQDLEIFKKVKTCRNVTFFLRIYLFCFEHVKTRKTQVCSGLIFRSPLSRQSCCINGVTWVKRMQSSGAIGAITYSLYADTTPAFRLISAIQGWPILARMVSDISSNLNYKILL